MTDLIVFLVVAVVAILAAVALMILPTGGASDVVVDHPPASDPQPHGWSAGAGVVSAFVVVLTTAGLVGWIFSGVSNGSGVARWDTAAAEFARDRATDAKTQTLDLLTDLGAALVLFTLMALLGVYHAVKRSDSGPLVYLTVVGMGVALLNNGLKLVVDRDRPDLAQLAGSAGSSFPSGHTATAAACWAGLFLVATRRRSPRSRGAAVAGAAAIAAIVAVTRVLLGVHWVSDVVAGLCVGWGWWLLVTIALGGRTLGLGASDPTTSREPRAADNVSNDRSIRPLPETSRP